jgi:hypothetical protein
VNSRGSEELLLATKRNLEINGFAVYVVDSASKAKEVFFGEILPALRPRSVSYADSLTLRETGIIQEVKELANIEFIETFDRTKPWDENIELRRKALLVDLFLAGANAITVGGQIVNLDMLGNRIGGITFGPKEVVLVAGKNKIVRDIEAGMGRIKAISAPRNAARHTRFSLPCQRVGHCVDCSSEQRICNAWSILEKCFPKKRIKVILIDEELGL